MAPCIRGLHRSEAGGPWISWRSCDEQYRRVTGNTGLTIDSCSGSHADMLKRPTIGSPLQALLLGAFSSLSVVGCAEEPPEPNALAITPVLGPAAEGGDPASGRIWQDVLASWPREGRLENLYPGPTVQSAMDHWMLGQQPLTMMPDIGRPVMEKVRAFNDRLIALDGAWGVLPEPDAVRAQAIRGFRKTLWSDARLAVAEQDAGRLVDILVVFATCPRIAHAFDASADGLMSTLGLVDGFVWAMADAVEDGFDIQLDAPQCERIRAAASWVELEAPFGIPAAEDVRRLAILNHYEDLTRPRIRALLDRLCD